MLCLICALQRPYFSNRVKVYAQWSMTLAYVFATIILQKKHTQDLLRFRRNERNEMPRFIEDFYYGNIEPQESNSEFRSELKKKLDRLTQLEKALAEKLQNEEKELLAEYIEKNLDFLSTSQVDSFVRGFRIGSEFTLDTFVKKYL